MALIDTIFAAGVRVSKSALRNYFGAREQITPDDYGTVDRTGATASTTALQAALNVGGDIYLKAGTYKLAASLSVAVAKTRLILAAGAILSFAAIGASTAAITVNANDFAIAGPMGKLVGPAAGAYVGDETMIKMVGTSGSVRKSGLRIEAEICNFGSYGIFAKWVDNIYIGAATNIHDGGYAGAMFLSCNKGTVAPGARIKDITPGTASNMYGISLTHVSTGYNAESPDGTKGSVNAFCQDWSILGLQVENVGWCAIDAHGAWGVSVSHCRTYNCKGGIQIAGGSGDAAAYAGSDNKVVNNLIDARAADGTAGSWANTGTAINVAATGGTQVRGQRIHVTGNSIYGYGAKDTTGTPVIQGSGVSGLVVSGNIIESWNGVAVGIDDAPDALVSGNIFRQLADASDTIARCVQNTTVSAVKQTLTGNLIDANGGTAAREGLYSRSTVRPFCSGNNFIAATSSTLNLAFPNFICGDDVMPIKTIDLGSGFGSNSYDLSEFAFGTPHIWLQLTAAGAATITDFTGIPGGTVLYVSVAPGSDVITINRALSALGGSANFASTSYDTITLLKFGTSGGIRLVELARSING